jgi:hypothetical protein
VIGRVAIRHPGIVGPIVARVNVLG